MAGIECLESGLIFRNPKPHLHSIHAYYPSVVMLNEAEMLAAFTLGEAFVATNLRVNIARSLDAGKTWHLEGPIYRSRCEKASADTCRISLMEEREIVAFLMQNDRSREGEGHSNPETLGHVETDLALLRSEDGGHTWSGPHRFEPPLAGSAFEMCSPIVALSDGRWILATSTWREWDGSCPSGLKMVAFISSDRGKSWRDYVDVMMDPRQEIIYWESKIVQLPDERLLAVAWAYNEKKARDLPNQYAISGDGGKTFSPPMSSGLQGQTLTPIVLDSGKILSVYRRMDDPGLWANISRLDGDTWINQDEAPLWGSKADRLVATSANMTQNFRKLQFGAPFLTPMPNGEIFVSFWCVEDCISNIRWLRLRISRDS
jgi:hypothetical protein